MLKYKVINMLGENEDGDPYRFSFPGQKFECESAYANSWRAGNHDVVIMRSVDGKPWEPASEAIEYARKRWNLDKAGYDQVLHELLSETSKFLTDSARSVKKGDKFDMNQLMEKVSELYSALEDRNQEE